MGSSLRRRGAERRLGSAARTFSSGVVQRSVLDRTDVILGAFDSEHTDLSLLGIMVRTGLPKTTVHRAVHKLVGLEWLELHEGRYSIGTRLLEFAGLSWAHAVLRRAALPTPQRQACTRETVHLAVSNGRDIVYIVVSPRALQAELSRVQDEGIAYDREEYRLGVECIAVPLLPTYNLCTGAISITAPSHKLKLRQLVPALRGAAADILRALPTAH